MILFERVEETKTSKILCKLVGKSKATPQQKLQIFIRRKSKQPKTFFNPEKKTQLNTTRFKKQPKKTKRNTTAKCKIDSLKKSGKRKIHKS
jgi:hypothetical protein